MSNEANTPTEAASPDISTDIEVKTAKEEAISSNAPRSDVRTSKHCINCGAEIDINAAMCPKCGVMQNKRPAGKSTMFCHNCGAVIDIKAEICPKCGVRQKAGGSGSGPSGLGGTYPTGEKSPLVAAILSILFVGLGHIYVGKWKRGLVLMAAAIILFITVIGWLAVLIAGAYDAYKLAEGEPGPLAFIDQYTHEE